MKGSKKMSSNCKELTDKFDKYFPCGHSNLRMKIDSTEHKMFIKKTEGGRMYDVDDNEYIDYINAVGPNILGHRHPEYVQSIKEFMDSNSPVIGPGMFYSKDDVVLGEKLVNHIPCADKVKLCMTGSDAVQIAIRLSRAYTGKQYFIRFAYQYHGWLDNVIGGVVDPSPDAKPFPRYDIDKISDQIKATSVVLPEALITDGKSTGSEKESFMLPWNDIDALETTLKLYGDEIAMIHFEPLVCNHYCQMPLPGFLERMRELCTQYGIVLSFDEVISGFRFGLNGAQGYFGVTPDIATYGKALGGGLPISVVAGKEEIMNLFSTGEVLGPGTFNGYPLGIRGAVATLEILEKNNGAIYKSQEKIQKKLTDGLKSIADKYNIPMVTQGALGIFYTIFGINHNNVIYTDNDLDGLDKPLLAKFLQGMTKEGILVVPDGRWYVSMAHNDEDIDRTLESAEKVMSSL